MKELSLVVRRALCLAVIGGLLAACSGQPAAQQADTASAPVVTADSEPQAVEIGPTAAAEQVQFNVSLRLPGAAELDAYLHDLVTPGSSSYQQYLAPEEFGARFGLSDARIAPIVAWLESGGLAAQLMPQRTSIAVSGSAGQVSDLLGVQLVDWENAAGTRYHVPVGEVAVPQSLEGDVPPS